MVGVVKDCPLKNCSPSPVLRSTLSHLCVLLLGGRAYSVGSVEVVSRGVEDELALILEIALSEFVVEGELVTRRGLNRSKRRALHIYKMSPLTL